MVIELQCSDLCHGKGLCPIKGDCEKGMKVGKMLRCTGGELLRLWGDGGLCDGDDEGCVHGDDMCSSTHAYLDAV